MQRCAALLKRHHRVGALPRPRRNFFFLLCLFASLSRPKRRGRRFLSHSPSDINAPSTPRLFRLPLGRSLFSESPLSCSRSSARLSAPKVLSPCILSGAGRSFFRSSGRPSDLKTVGVSLPPPAIWKGRKRRRTRRGRIFALVLLLLLLFPPPPPSPSTHLSVDIAVRFRHERPSAEVKYYSGSDIYCNNR